jgi:hypothetical protein
VTNISAIGRLSQLCEIDPPEVSGQTVEEAPDGWIYRALIDVGALIQSGVRKNILCLACDDAHYASVEHIGDGRYRAYCPVAGYQSVPAATLARFAVDEDWIAETIGTEVGLAPQTAQRGAAATWIGRARFGPYPCHLFFARALSDPAQLAGAVALVRSTIGETSATLITSTPLDLIAGDPPPRCKYVHLDEVLSLDSSRVRLREDPFYSALGQPPKYVPGSEAVGFQFSPGYRSVLWGENDFSFSDKQSLVIEALHDARLAGTGRLHQTELQGVADTSQRMTELFRRHPAYGTLIKNDGTGYYWLNL